MSTSRSPRYQRARLPERKQERREAILAAAERVVERDAYATVRLDRVARHLGLAKGTLYLYYPTKEALFLAVIRRAFERFFDRVAAEIGARATRGEVVGALLAGLDAAPALPHLASVLHTVLEHNVADADLAEFKHFLRERVGGLGARIDRGLRWPRGSGALLLLRFHVLLIGLHHAATPSRAVARVLTDRRLALFRIDFRAQLAAMLRLVMQPLPQEE